MTPQEHELLELKIKGLAQELMINWLAGLWRMQLAITREPERSMTLASMEAKLRAGATEYSEITLPWLDAATSDMQSAMFQEAYEEISKKVLATARAGLTPDEEAKFRAAAAAGFPSIKR